MFNYLIGSISIVEDSNETDISQPRIYIYTTWNWNWVVLNILYILKLNAIRYTLSKK